MIVQRKPVDLSRLPAIIIDPFALPVGGCSLERSQADDHASFYSLEPRFGIFSTCSHSVPRSQDFPTAQQVMRTTAGPFFQVNCLGSGIFMVLLR